MPKRAIPLTAASADQAMPREKLYKLFDGDGLYLEVQPSGAKSWRMKYHQKNGRENVLTFGRYPDISIAQAREYAHTARQMLKHELDPRTEFNWQKLNPPPAPIPLERLIDENDWEHVQASILRVARHTIQQLEAALFPACHCRDSHRCRPQQHPARFCTANRKGRHAGHLSSAGRHRHGSGWNLFTHRNERRRTGLCNERSPGPDTPRQRYR